MPLDPDRIVAYLDAAELVAAWPDGCPPEDCARSAAAARVGSLAARDALFAFHFEHRAHRPIPAAFLDDDATDEDAAPPEWTDGALPEPKYQAFRHDLPVASFHPGHRGKWTTHELCHALVGYAWRPDASPLFHATAARLSELVPVVLYYLLDEIGLRRCPEHDGGGPLYRAFCPACEAAAALGPRPLRSDDRDAAHDAARYLDRELAAIARTRRTGVPIGHRFGALDLCTDGLAYARAHGPRLGSEAFARYVAAFAPTGCWPDLDALEGRVVDVARAIAEGEPLASLAPPGGRWAWVVQDLGWRLLAEAESLDDRALADEVIDRLAAAEPGPAAVADAAAAWEAADLPAEALQVGYDLGGGRGHALGQLADGLRSAVPLCVDAFDDAGVDPVPAFAVADAWVRRPLADRFAAWLDRAHPGPLAGLARFEAALRHAGSDPLVSVLGPGEGPWRVAPGVRLLRESFDPVALADEVESGARGGIAVGGRVTLDAPPHAETILLVARDAQGEVAVAELDPGTASALDGGPGPADPELIDTLVEIGMVRPTTWPVDPPRGLPPASRSR